MAVKKAKPAPKKPLVKKAEPAKKKEEPKKSAKKEAPKKAAPKKEAPKKAAPKKEAPKKEATRTYHLVKRPDGKWEVKFAGGEKAITLFERQDEAIVYSRKMSKNQKGAMLIHNSKGKNKGRIKSK